MKEQDQKIIEKITEALPHMSEYHKGVLYGIAYSNEKKVKKDK